MSAAEDCVRQAIATYYESDEGDVGGNLEWAAIVAALRADPAALADLCGASSYVSSLLDVAVARAEKAEAERDALTKAAQELVKATRKRLTTAGYHAIELQVDALARLAFTPTEDES